MSGKLGLWICNVFFMGVYFGLLYLQAEICDVCS